MNCLCVMAPVDLASAMKPLRVWSAALMLCAMGPTTAGAQVTYFHRPPTPEQLRAALLPPSGPAAAPAPGGAQPLPGGSRPRGIVLQPQGEIPGAAAAAGGVVAAAGGGGARAAALPINFDLGSSRVDRDSLPYIETIAALMRADPSLRLTVEGHTDDRGAFNHNMVLSWDRAIGVFRVLVETFGVEPTRLQLTGKGPLEPLPGTEPSDGSNRRVQFRITG